MAHIKRIGYSHVHKSEGCLCDNCGQFITNIVTVTFAEGEQLHFGTDCYNKRIVGKLNAFGRKELNRIMKGIKEHSILLNDLQKDEPTALVQKEWESYKRWQTAWADRPFEEWKSWMIPTVTGWLEKDNKELEKFKKINF